MLRQSARIAVFQSSHWGELIQGPVLHRGHLHTGLITLPRANRGAIATFTPSLRSGLTVVPPGKQKALKACRSVLERAGRSDVGGRLTMANTTPPNGGAGSSTSDVTAAARATCRAIRYHMTASDLQKLVFDVEGASDPLALTNDSRTVMYGSRCGEVFENIHRSLPSMACLGFVSDPTSTVLTESLVGGEAYTKSEAIEFSKVISEIKRGISLSRVDMIASAATKSARLNQFRLPTRHFEELVRISIAAGALGLAVSHSGVTAAAIFDPFTSDLIGRARWMASCVYELGCAEIDLFAV